MPATAARQPLRSPYSPVRRAEPAICWTLAILFVSLFLADVIRTRPLIEEEFYRYIPFYVTNRHLGSSGELLKIFDSYALESGDARYRPLCRLAELIDAHLLIAVNRVAPAVEFRSIVHAALILLTVCFAAIVFGRLAPALPRAFCWMVAAWFCVIPPCLERNALYARLGKAMTCVVLCVIFLTWLRYRNRTLRQAMQHRWDLWQWIGLTALLCLGTAVDEQGIAYLAMLAGLGVIEWIRRRTGGAYLLSAVIGLLFYALNMAFVAPWAYAQLSGGPIHAFADPRSYLRWDLDTLHQLATAVAGQFGMLLGGYPAQWPTVVPLAAAAIVGLLIWRPREPADEPAGMTLAEAAYWVGLQLAVLYAMALRHPPMLGRVWWVIGYYYLCADLLIYLCTIALLARWRAMATPGRRLALAAILALLAIKNFATAHQVDEYRQTYASYMPSEDVIRGVLDGRPISPAEWRQVSPDAAQFLYFFIDATRTDAAAVPLPGQGAGFSGHSPP